MSKLLAGRYELTGKIGEGGMAVVYKAKDRLLNRYVAIKILRPEYTKDEQFVQNFKKESQAAAGLQHPNIVSIYDVGKSGNINYIVMELIDGKPLSDLIHERGTIDYRTVLKISEQVASALSLAHKHNIIHRDVKPHNIMITKDGTAKLTDFGIAKAVSNATMVAETSRIIGSVHYFSPEQARGAHVDERSDIYSLGIVIYEMLTGQVPYDGENPVEVALKHLNEEMTPPSKLVGGIPPALEKLVLKATDKYPGNRYKSADEMLDDLQNVEYITKMVGPAAFVRRDGSFTPNAESKSDEGEVVIEKKSKNSGAKKNKKKIAVLSAIIGAIVLVAIILTLYVSGIIGGGGKEIKVPDVRGKTYEEAKKILEANDLKIKEADMKVASDKVEKDKIVSQDPKSGIKVKAGRAIIVTLSSGKDKIEAPDLTNKTYDEAKQLLADMGLQITKGESLASDDIPVDKIVSQFPEAGSEVKKDDIITVNLSSGPGEAVVPKLVGIEYTSESDIEALLERHGYSLNQVSYEESYEKPGIIIKQSPEAGTTAKKGTAVDIVISKAKPTVEVPDLSGLSESQAANKLAKLELSVGEVKEETTSDEKSDGLIINQNPSPGSELMPGSTVNIAIGKYVAPPEESKPPAEGGQSGK